MKKSLAIWFLLLAALSAKTQDFPSELWHEGWVALANDDTISGSIKYNLKQDLIQIEVQEKIFTYSAKKVLYFQIFDQTVDSYRQFYTLPYALVNEYEIPVFFEVLVEGRLTLLSREAIVMKTVQDSNPYPYGSRMSYSREELEYTYYFLDSKGNIELYTMKKRDLLRVLSKRYDKINEYMKVNHLKHDRRTDIVRIISFYNGIL